MMDKPHSSPNGDMGKEINEYTQAAEAAAQDKGEKAARYEVFFAAQEIVREAYQEEVLVPRQEVWTSLTDTLRVEPMLSWQTVDELVSADGQKAKGDIRAMWEFESIQYDDKGTAHAYVSTVTAGIPLEHRELDEVLRAKSYLRWQMFSQASLRGKTPEKLLGLVAEGTGKKRSLPAKSLQYRLDQFIGDKVQDAVEVSATLTHTILGVDRPPQTFTAKITENDVRTLDQVPTLRAQEAVADIMYNRIRQRDRLDDPTIEEIARTLADRLDWNTTHEGYDNFRNILEIVHLSTARVK